MATAAERLQQIVTEGLAPQISDEEKFHAIAVGALNRGRLTTGEANELDRLGSTLGGVP